MSDASVLFDVLRNSVDPKIADAIETLVADGSDRDLCRVNAFAFAGRAWLGRGTDHRRIPACRLAWPF